MKSELEKIVYIYIYGNINYFISNSISAYCSMYSLNWDGIEMNNYGLIDYISNWAIQGFHWISQSVLSWSIYVKK